MASIFFVLTPSPTHYREPFWTHVARTTGIELLVSYLAKESHDRPWCVTWPRDFPFRELPGCHASAWRGLTEVCYRNPQAARLVHPRRCDALILAGRHVVLFVGQLIPNKNVHTLIEACSALPGQSSRRLVVGEGTLRPYLDQLTRCLGIVDGLRWVGFAQAQALPDWYLAVNALVSPSSEACGPPALEYLACGLPVIVSDQTGCGSDVLPDGEPGDYVFPFGNAAATECQAEVLCLA